jgi:hypothetical protein
VHSQAGSDMSVFLPRREEEHRISLIQDEVSVSQLLLRRKGGSPRFRILKIKYEEIDYEEF